MNERDFVYWLKGFIELTGDSSPNFEQWQMIKDHLALVMTKVVHKGTVTNSGVLVKSGKDVKINEQTGVPDWTGPFRIQPIPNVKGQWAKDWLEQKRNEIQSVPYGTPFGDPDFKLGNIYC